MTAEEYFKEHGINQASLQKFDVTYNKKKIILPVKDEEGNVLFNKYRHLDFDKTNPDTKKFSYDEGSHASLFNVSVLLDNNYVFLTEGEFDCIRLDQEGISAVSNTSGAGTFKEEWVALLEGKKVYVLYDNDKAGIEGSQKILDLLPTAIIIKLPEEYKDVCEYFMEHTKDEFRTLCDIQIKANTITLDEFNAIIDKWLLLPDKNVIYIFLACLVSHFFNADPLWMFFVAPPSGSKTEIISTAIDLPFVKMLSNLTPQTLVSGMISKNDPSLLMQLKNHVLIMKDFTTILSMRSDDKMNILSQLREVYDGRYSKAFGTGKTIEWEGKITLLAGVTPAIDLQSGMNQIMGERFIMYRVPQADPKLVARKALSNSGSEKAMRKEMLDAMTKFFQSIVIPDIEKIELPEPILAALADLATFVVRARSQIIRDPYRRDILDIPMTEAPARLAKQLGTLCKGLAPIFGRSRVTWFDYYLTMKVGFDIITSNRMTHLLSLCDIETYTLRTTEIAAKTRYSTQGSVNILDDLAGLGLLRVVKGEGTGTPTEWGLSDDTIESLKDILPYTTEDLLKVFPKGSMYEPLIAEMIKHSKEIDEKEDHQWQMKTELPF